MVQVITEMFMVCRIRGIWIHEGKVQIFGIQDVTPFILGRRCSRWTHLATSGCLWNLWYLHNFLVLDPIESSSCLLGSHHCSQNRSPVEGVQIETDQVVGSIFWVNGTTLEYMEACGERQVLSVKDLPGSVSG